MRHILAVFLLLSGATRSRAQHTSTRQSSALLVRIAESEVNMYPTGGPAVADECLVLTPGQVHLELRRQEFLKGGRATLATYEGTLNSKQVDRVRTILDSAAIRSLPQFVTPTTPMGMDSYHVITAKISRSSSTQTIGYFEWQGEAPANASIAGQNWSRSAAAMKLLIEWFHDLKSTYEWRQVPNSRSGVCGEY